VTPVRPGLVLAICCTSLFLVTVDGTIVNVALPSIRSGLGASVTGLQWVVDGYLLVLTSLLILAGTTADRVGRRRVFVTGLVVFGLGSLLCGLAPSTAWLVAARVLQGVGGAMLNPVALALIVSVQPTPAARARAIGAWSAVSGLGIAAGPPLGGLVVDLVGWRWVFIVNVPVVVAAVLLTLRFVPTSRSAVRRPLDVPGQVLLTLAVAALVFAIIEGPHLAAAPLAATVAVLVVAVAALGRVELRHPAPLVDPRLFRARGFSAAVLAAVAGFAAFSGCLFALTLTLQGRLGLTPAYAGLLALPLGLAALVTSPRSGRLTARGHGWGALTAAGLTLAAGALVLLVVLHPAEPVTALVLVGTAGFGVGFGLLNPPITTTAVAGLPPERAGVAAAIASTARQLGQSLGVAVVGGLVVAHASLAWLVPAGLGVAVAGLGVLGRTAPRHTRRDTTSRQLVDS
jgi:EmrB/QacA subfamily drug resistance transporter